MITIERFLVVAGAFKKKKIENLKQNLKAPVTKYFIQPMLYNYFYSFTACLKLTHYY